MFVFKIDEGIKLVRLEVAGIMSVSEAEKLNQEMLINASTARRQFGVFRVLVDARLYPVQSADTISSFRPPSEVLKGNDRYGVVVGSTLSKLQANRVFDTDQARAFSSMDEAESWLLEDLR